jgi:hypothetical protein
MEEKVRQYKDLTPNEKKASEDRAYSAFKANEARYNPPPPPVGIEVITQNKSVTKALTKAMGYLPVLLLLAAVASAIVSMDKTAWAFEQSVAIRHAPWKYIVAIAAVAMIEISLPVIEYEIVRQQLESGKEDVKEFWTLAGAFDTICWRIGFELRGSGKNRKWKRVNAARRAKVQVIDPALLTWRRIVTFVALLASVVSITKLAGINSVGDMKSANITKVLMVAIGAAGVISLMQIGRVVAHIMYRSAKAERAERERVEKREWEAGVIERWKSERDDMVNAEFHRVYVIKNKLPDNAETPYRVGIIDGEGLEIVDPFVSIAPAPSNGRR